MFSKIQFVLGVAILQVLVQSEQAYGTCVDGFLPDTVIRYIFDTDTDGETVIFLCPEPRPGPYRHQELRGARALRSRDSPEYQFFYGALRLIERAYPSRHRGLLNRFDTAYTNGNNGFLDWNRVTGRSYTRTVAWVSEWLIPAARVTGDNREFSRLFSVASTVARYRQGALRMRNRNPACDGTHQFTLDTWNQLLRNMSSSDVGQQTMLSCRQLNM